MVKASDGTGLHAKHPEAAVDAVTPEPSTKTNAYVVAERPLKNGKNHTSFILSYSIIN